MTIEQRVELLEKELARTIRLVRWLPGITIFVCLLAFGLFEPVASRLFAQQTQKPGEVIATKFTLIDSEDKPRATLSIMNSNPTLLMHDNVGYVRAGFYISDKGPTIGMYDDNGTRRAVLYLDENGPALSMADNDGTTRAGLHVDENGPTLGMQDKNGKPRVNIGIIKTTTSDGQTIIYPESSIVLSKPDGSILWGSPSR